MMKPITRKRRFERENVDNSTTAASYWPGGSCKGQVKPGLPPPLLNSGSMDIEEKER